MPWVVRIQVGIYRKAFWAGSFNHCCNYSFSRIIGENTNESFPPYFYASEWGFIYARTEWTMRLQCCYCVTWIYYSIRHWGNRSFIYLFGWRLIAVNAIDSGETFKRICISNSEILKHIHILLISISFVFIIYIGWFKTCKHGSSNVPCFLALCC